MPTAIKATLGGKAIVVCVHDRQKRLVNTPDDVAKLGRSLKPPLIFDPKKHKIHKCVCCENLFVDPTDTPRVCTVCDPANPLQHKLAVPLGEAIGVWDA